MVKKKTATNSGDLGSIPGSERSSRGGRGNPLECSCLENPMARGTWKDTVHRIAESRTQLKGLTHRYNDKSFSFCGEQNVTICFDTPI